jgi:uncharacterized protein with GYD domain
MAKYLFSGSYTEAGLQGLLKEGGSGRREATERLIKSLGGSLEAYYFAFGGQDFYLIADLPDNRAAAAGSLVAAASGAVRPVTTVLLTPEEIDEAVSRTVDYRPPGR